MKKLTYEFYNADPTPRDVKIEVIAHDELCNDLTLIEKTFDGSFWNEQEVEPEALVRTLIRHAPNDYFVTMD